MIRVRELIKELSKFSLDTVVSIQDESDENNESVLLDDIKIHRVFNMPAVLLCGRKCD
uniref:Uncharacterized protein n=1 Tax=viral metagenome TaxID=1070528 RepID=A0A6M3IMU7_9ZZZZ